MLNNGLEECQTTHASRASGERGCGFVARFMTCSNFWDRFSEISFAGFSQSVYKGKSNLAFLSQILFLTPLLEYSITFFFFFASLTYLNSHSLVREIYNNQSYSSHKMFSNISGFVKSLHSSACECIQSGGCVNHGGWSLGWSLHPCCSEITFKDSRSLHVTTFSSFLIFLFQVRSF